MNKHVVCYTCDENIPEESIKDSTTCPECGGKVADRWGKVWIVESKRRRQGEDTKHITGL